MSVEDTARSLDSIPLSGLSPNLEISWANIFIAAVLPKHPILRIPKLELKRVL